MKSSESRKPKLRIGVVGTFIRDHTLPYEGEPYDNIGGILYSLACLAALAEEGTEIIPVARVGADLYDEVRDALRPFAAISQQYLLRSDRPNTRVELHYVSPNERYEKTSERMPPLEWSEVEVLAGCDAILVNMITGTDIALEALQRLSSETRGWIYLDFHSLAYELDEEGRRRLVRPRDWRAWVACADGLQVNEAEACILSDGSSRETGVHRFGEHVTAEMVQVCNVTAGSRGSHLFWRQDGAVLYQWIPAVRPPRVVDVVGCGDAFAAGFIYTYARSRDPVQAAREASRVAAANCVYPGTTGMQDLPRLLRQLDGRGSKDSYA